MGEGANHFLTMAVLLLAFLFSSSLSLSLSSLSRAAAAAAAGQRGNQGFLAISIVNDNNGIEQKRQ
jgi:hypothetical protein